MIIKSVMGTVLYNADTFRFKGALEGAIRSGVDFSHGDFRGRKLYNAKLDGLLAPGASFWGADCRQADMSCVNLKDADLRNVDFKDASLAESDLSGANLSGAYFSSTIIRDTNLEGAIFSCPSIFTCDLSSAANLHRAVYSHLGEIDISLEKPPIVINGLTQRMIFFEKHALFGRSLIHLPEALRIFLDDLKTLRSTINGSA